MSFLNGLFFTALIPLLGLPLLVHLLNLTFPTLLNFPSIKHLIKTSAQRSKIYTYRHLILMLIRTAFLALLMLAFLKPLWQRYGALAKHSSVRQVVILMDHSLSMEYTELGTTPRKRAIQEATKIINGLRDDDLVNVLLVENMARPLFMATTRDHGELLAQLHLTKPGYTVADFTAASRSASEQLDSENANKEVYCISDFQRSNWADVDFSALPDDVRCLYVNVGPEDGVNRAILGASFNKTQLRAGDTAILDVKIGNYSDEPFEGPVTVLMNDHNTLEATASLGPWAVGSVSFPMKFTDDGLYRCEIRLPKDRIEGDDSHFIATRVLTKEPILLVTDAHRWQSRPPAFFIEAALNPFARNDKRASMAPTMTTSDKLSSARLVEVRKMFLSNIKNLSDDVCGRLAEFVFDGGAIIYFLDGEKDGANLKAMKEAFGAIPLTLYAKRSLKQVADGGQQIASGEFRSPHLQLFRGALRRNLGLLEVYDFYSASHTGDGDVILSYTDGTPAMATMQHGLGTVILMNFSVNELSSNLARQRIFPAWMHELTESLSPTEATPISYPVGERVHAEVWKEALHTDGIRTPDGRRTEMSHERRGARYGISFVPEMPGFHTLGSPKISYICGVNPPAKEADLRAVDNERLAEADEGELQGYFVAERENYQDVAWGVPIFHFFILAAILFLTFEIAMQWLAEKFRSAA